MLPLFCATRAATVVLALAEVAATKLNGQLSAVLAGGLGGWRCQAGRGGDWVAAAHFTAAGLTGCLARDHPMFRKPVTHTVCPLPAGSLSVRWAAASNWLVLAAGGSGGGGGGNSAAALLGMLQWVTQLIQVGASLIYWHHSSQGQRRRAFKLTDWVCVRAKACSRPLASLCGGQSVFAAHTLQDCSELVVTLTVAWAATDFKNRAMRWWTTHLQTDRQDLMYAGWRTVSWFK